jgi:hypothetical protein
MTGTLQAGNVQKSIGVLMGIELFSSIHKYELLAVNKNHD